MSDMGADRKGTEHVPEAWKPEARYGTDPDRLFLSPDDDLAPNRPGEALRARLASRARGGPSLFLARVLGRHPPEDSWRRELAGESAVGAELDLLAPGGWHILHCLPLPPDLRIAHLLIGPGGVLCVASHYAPRARVRVDETTVRMNRGRRPQPYVRMTRQAAERASYALSRGCGFRVEVRPVLAFVGASRVETEPALKNVRVVSDIREIGTLGRLGGVLAPERVERVYTVARNRRTWLIA